MPTGPRRLGRSLLRVTAAGAALAGSITLADPASAATYSVTSIDDVGAGSLRQAVFDANGNPGADVITFDLRWQGSSR